MSVYYRVEIDDPGCTECSHGRTFHVIGPDEVASSTSYDDEEEANALARELNHAYKLGQQSQKITVADQWIPFASQKPPESRHILVWDAQFQVPTGIYYIAEVYTDAHVASMQFTHWMHASALGGPHVPAAEQPPVIEPAPIAEPPTLQPAPGVIIDWDDDIPFGFVGLIPLAGLLAHAAKTLFQV